MSKPSLDDAVISKLFLRLRVNYGASFDRQMTAPPGVSISPEDYALIVRKQWAEELAGYASNLDAIAYALQHLPDFMPSLPEFKAICRRAPMPTFKALPLPAGTKPTPQMLETVANIGRPSDHDPKAWAWRLAERERNSAPLTQAQRHMWREALHVPTGTRAAEFLERAAA